MSWQQLADIYAEAAAEAQDEADRPPVACPIDGEPLEENSEGVLNCPFGNFRWQG